MNDSFRQTHYNILGYDSDITHHVCVIQQRILKNALIYENKQLLNQLENCAKEIRNYIYENKISSQIIFAPLHTVSDIIQTTIAALVTKKPTIVVSVYDSMAALDAKQNNNSQGISIEQFNPESMTGNSGSEFHNIVSSLLENQKNLVIFPDAIPECTTRFTNKKMKTYSVKMFGNSCELHTGLPVFSRLLKQKALFFSINFDQKNNLKMNVIDCMGHKEMEQRMPQLVEDCIRKYNNEWTLWHYTSFFSYNY
ncbi:hypothetical protein CO704_00050 [Cedecea neteri]|uniref:Uncharacterized protein n=2 Tax=Cedecea neteri TaxID=158822 RepID=A0A291DS97_9ENTR|nr:hypothetical protein CO704_00050 [Cedecea neteri]